MKASPKRPNASIPFVTVLSLAPPATESVRSTVPLEEYERNPPLDSRRREPRRNPAMPITPPASKRRYPAITVQCPSHLPSTISRRRIGRTATVWITPEAISPESVSTGRSTAVITVRRFAA
jgi:hypothetical protein